MQVLVPLDAAPGEDVVLEYCRSLVPGADPTFVLAHVIALPRFVDPDRARRSEQFLAEAARKFRTEGMRVTTIVRQGEPGPQITALARLIGADLIVLPSHRGHWMDGHPHEDVLEYLLLHADQPVIAINDQGFPETRLASDATDRAAREAS